MTKYIIQRLLLAALLTWLSASFVFGILRVMPGDPALLILGAGEGKSPSEADLARVRRELMLDRPIVVQYGLWMRDLVGFNLGTSFRGPDSVRDEVFRRFPRTLELVVGGLVVGLVVGIPTGIVAALRRGGTLDLLLSTVVVLGISLPFFVTGPILALLFIIQLPIFVIGYVPPDQGLVEHLRRLVLPVVALGLFLGASTSRMVRSSMLEVLGQDYIRTARAKGLLESLVLVRHALKNALIPPVSLVGVQIGALLGGTVVIEYVFNWPGLSTLLIDATQHRDYPFVQGTLVVIAFGFILINLLVDLVVAWLDPRISHG